MADKFTNSKYYYNRELSWIRFNYRVLTEAQDERIPLLSRFKFLSITASNLDEFFMVRVASLKDMIHAGYKKRDISGLTPALQIKAISGSTHALINEQYETYHNLTKSLKKTGINLITHHEDLSGKQLEYVDNYFMTNIYPVLTPMAVDSSRPFPLIRNKSLNICALLKPKKSSTEGKDESFRDLYISNKSKKKSSKLPKGVEFATVQVPAGMARLVEIPTLATTKESSKSANKDENASVEQKLRREAKLTKKKTFITLEQIIERNIDKLFINNEVICAFPYRLMRNADLTIEEEDAADLLIEIEKQIKKRQWGEVIKLEIEKDMDPILKDLLSSEFAIDTSDVYEINGPLDLTFLMKVANLEGYDNLRAEELPPQPARYLNVNDSIFHQIRMHDILLHHPFETFDPVVAFIKRASRDDKVLAIKQTLYRVSSNSPIIASLAEAAQNGKQVTVLVELKARFDEENNIIWARKLEQAGCHVLYGLVGLKTHSKITLVVRKEDDGIRRYVHLGTGNYNDSTAKQYTDLGLLTCNKLIGEDATAVFNMLSGYSEPAVWNKLSIAPIWLRDKFYSLIQREIESANRGEEASITAKMNSLCDLGIIAELYRASAAGVKIKLLIRGICCLKVGIPGISENIEVRSIVGTFLEHSRIFKFHNSGNEEIYLASADWMPRNLDKRIEIMFPIEDTTLKDEINNILKLEFEDNVKAHELQADGSYKKLYPKSEKTGINSQLELYKLAEKNS
ncbi:MAG: polyphosphate kinase 1, partial [Lachnospiraceae bacterium]|nr:polyphosphate kinase 1 [Lachnospiraceae bacterium]